MAILGHKKLLDLLETQALAITPLLHPDQIGKAAIDLRMGNVVKLVRSRGIPVVDPLHYRKISENDDIHIHKSRQQKLERHDVPFGENFYLHPGTLALVPTLEWVSLPDDLLGMVTARSSWAREGLNIATATFINPGYSGIITLELANLGSVPMKLYPGLRVAQIALYEVTPNLVPDSSLSPESVASNSQSQFHQNYEPEAGNLWDPQIDPFIGSDLSSETKGDVDDSRRILFSGQIGN